MKPIILCAAAMLLAPAIGQAAPSISADGRPLVMTVSHGDLDLSTQHGARIMIRRLDEAAAALCGGDSFAAREAKQGLRSTACYRDSMSRAVADLGSPTVNALYNGPASSVASR